MVAIDMRGYGETDRPPNKSDYTIDLLTQDIVELIPALGHSQCTLVSHDWGGAVAWSVYALISVSLIILVLQNFQ